ncbi:MAG: hypothetical protein PHT33_04405 [bacterium]|nr:hypothetical protein [bacterium]
MYNRELILETLEVFPKGLCDDCLSGVTNIRPRQQVNQICRLLKEEGTINRHQMVCPHGCSQNKKLINLLKAKTVCEFSESKSRTDTRTIVNGCFPAHLDDLRRQMIRMLDIIEGDTARGQGFSERISRLRNDKTLPGEIACVMQTINAIRNLVVYEHYMPNQKIEKVISDSWDVLIEWSQDIKVG